MIKMLAVSAAVIALSAGATMAQTTTTQAQTTPPGVTCTKTPPTEPGAGNGSSADVKQHFVKGSCEELVMPNGRTEISNGPAATDPNGTAAPHESP